MKSIIRFVVLLLGATMAYGGCYAATNASNPFAVSSVPALRAMPAVQYPNIYLTQYNATTGIGGGEFVYTGQSSCSDNSGTLFQAVGGCYARKTNGQGYNPAWFGAACAGVEVTDGVSTSSSATITSASAQWGTVKAGWIAVVNKAAASSLQLVTTVSAVNSSSSVTLAATAGASHTGETIYLFPDDHVAILAAFAAINSIAPSFVGPGSSVGITLPNGRSCGMANPGSTQSIDITAPGFQLNLNSGRLWLGQTGTGTDTGYQLHFIRNSQSIIGPGTIDGQYQTNSGIAQQLGAVFFQGGVGGRWTNNFVSNFTISNTKGTALEAGGLQDFTANGVIASDCGDYSFVPGSGDPETGRQFCFLIAGNTGITNLSNLTAYRASQSGILIQDFASDAGLSAVVNINNFVSYDAGYYGFDLEEWPGTINASNITTTTAGVCSPSGSTFVCGGTVANELRFLNINGLTSIGIDGNAASLQMTSGIVVPSQYWSLQNVTLYGTASSHAASMFVSMDGNEVPAHIYLDNVVTDRLNTFISPPVCVAANPYRQLFEFHNFRVSHLYTGGAPTTFGGNPALTGLSYYLGSDSDLGAVAINMSTTNNPLTPLYDFFRVYMGTITFTGVTSVATYGGTTWTNPLTSFTCPT